MSNALSVAMVTTVLGWILDEVLTGSSPGGVQSAKVTTSRPDVLGTDDLPGINVFLYQVVPNANWAGAGLPARRSDGSVHTRPQQALDLHYLLTFSGDDSKLEPQRLLGLAISTLTAEPVLSRALLRYLVRKAAEAAPPGWEWYSDLAEQIDIVRVSPLPLSLEELSKLWSTFFQAPYRLSMTYQATAVLLDSDVTPPHAALPVHSRTIEVSPVHFPSITRVVADSAPTDPVVPGTILRVEGERLRGAVATRVRLAGVEVDIPADDGTDMRLTFRLPLGVPAGLHGVQVRHPRRADMAPHERDGAESNAAPVLVRPVVKEPVVAAPDPQIGVTVPLDPPVRQGQRVVLLLNERHPPPDSVGRAYTFVAPPWDPPGTVTEVTVPVPGVVAGNYLVRVQVDGAQSPLTTDSDGAFDQPEVTIT